MIYSLGEIDAQAKKAVRGAGFSWGYAEEAGKAVRFLAAHQLPGWACLLAYLQQQDEYDSQTCPIRMAAHLLDTSPQYLTQDTQRLFDHVAYPLLLLPAVALIGRQYDLIMHLSWQGVEFFCQNMGLASVIDQSSDVTQALTHQVQVSRVETCQYNFAAPGRLGQFVADDAWLNLGQFAYRTYVPASEDSRRGAGPA